MIEQLIYKAAKLKSEITEKTAYLRDLNKQIEQAAVFEAGKKSAKVIGGGYIATVQRKDNVKWDQSKLATIADKLPASFQQAFKAEYKPASAKALETAMLTEPEFAKAVDWARTIKPGAPQIKFEPLEA